MHQPAGMPQPDFHLWAPAALVTAGQYNRLLMEAFAAEAVPRIQEYHSQNLANLTWAFGKLGHLDTDLMAAISRRAVEIAKVRARDRSPAN